MLPTPLTDHINFDRVYEPAEDSYLLLDALSARSEIDFLSDRFPHTSPTPLIAEIGTGSGVVLAFVAANAETLLGRRDVLVLGTDVNPFACSAAEETVRIACVDRDASGAGSLGAVNAHLEAALRPGSVDILVFNPPYVPSDDVPAVPETAVRGDAARQRDFAYLALATDGGADGMEVTAPVLERLPEVLSARGVAYVLLCRRNRPEHVRDGIHAWDGGGRWVTDVVKDSGRKGGIENLCILRIARKYSRHA